MTSTAFGRDLRNRDDVERCLIGDAKLTGYEGLQLRYQEQEQAKSSGQEQLPLDDVPF